MTGPQGILPRAFFGTKVGMYGRTKHDRYLLGSTGIQKLQSLDAQEEMPRSVRSTWTQLHVC